MQSVLNYAWPKSQIGDYMVQNQLQSMMWVLRKQNWRIIRPRALFLDQLSQITFILNGRLFSKLFSLYLDSQVFLGSHSRRNHLVLLLDSNELIYSSRLHNGKYDSWDLASSASCDKCWFSFLLRRFLSRSPALLSPREPTFHIPKF